VVSGALEMTQVYTVSAFAAISGLSEEYIRQCCRGKAVGESGNIPRLPTGCKASKVGGQWQIVCVFGKYAQGDTTGNVSEIPGGSSERLLKSATEEELITALVAKWEGAAWLESLLSGEERPLGNRLPTAERLIQQVGTALNWAATHEEGVELAVAVDRLGSHHLSLRKPNEPLLDILLSSHGVTDLELSYMWAWYEQLFFKANKSKGDQGTIPRLPANASKRTEDINSFLQRCFECGKTPQGMRKNQRYCNENCKRAFNSWIARTALCSPAVWPANVRAKLARIRSNLR
jgi:hypothetical protein